MSKNSNQYAAWRNVTPLHNALVGSIIHSACHVIATMRAKEKYVLEANEQGRQTVKKLGMEAIQREGLNFEFDLVGDMDSEHNLIITKTRIKSFDGDLIKKPGKDVAKRLLDFLNSGADVVPPQTDDNEPIVVEKVAETPDLNLLNPLLQLLVSLRNFLPD